MLKSKFKVNPKQKRSSLENTLKIETFHWSLLPIIAVSACGSSEGNNDGEAVSIGFLSSYKEPVPTFSDIISPDPNFKILETQYIQPYWVNSLEMENGLSTISSLLGSSDRILFYSFPNHQPSYIPLSIYGWSPASNEIALASREIFEKLGSILDVNFEEKQGSEGTNNLVIAESIQPSTAGYSFFPNNFYELGSDVFMSREHNSPFYISENITNYDYEILLHEIGHALGLKHPFAADGSNASVLSGLEDKTYFTAMSYDESSAAYSGEFRPLDLMALTKFYGVSPLYNAKNDTYNFNSFSGTFIVDGGGVDKIDAASSSDNIYIDLRPGGHSYKGSKSNFITDANQLTISHGTRIEDVTTGSGDDYIIGNELSNSIITSSGNDKIFSSEGSDTVNSGSGIDIVDFSEDQNSLDTLILDTSTVEDSFDTIYGFVQGATGDVVKMISYKFNSLHFLPLIDVDNVPSGHISSSLIRIFGTNVDTEQSLNYRFNVDGTLSKLKLYTGESALVISSNSQDLGANQDLFVVSNDNDYIVVNHLAQFVGVNLDIDLWHSDNFLV